MVTAVAKKTKVQNNKITPPPHHLPNKKQQQQQQQQQQLTQDEPFLSKFINESELLDEPKAVVKPKPKPILQLTRNEQFISKLFDESELLDQPTKIIQLKKALKGTVKSYEVGIKNQTDPLL